MNNKQRAHPRGKMHPDIVMYNAYHSSGDVITEYANFDLKKKPDLLVVVGSSLQVRGFRNMVKTFAADVLSRNGQVCHCINRSRLC